MILYDGSWSEVEDNENSTPLKVPVMKMIDFANCIVNANLLRPMPDNEVPGGGGMGEEDIKYVNYPPTTRGPDTGYLLGLGSLIRSFEELERDYGSGKGYHVQINRNEQQL